MTAERQNQLIADAKHALKNKIIYEPRIYFDRIEMVNTLVDTNGHPEVFRNGEAFPVTLTHLTLWSNDNPAGDNAAGDFQDLRRAIQQTTLQLNYHEQVYPPRAAVLPLFANKVTATGNNMGTTDGTTNIGQWTSSWDFTEFDKPFVLGARQAIELDCSFSGVIVTTQDLSVSFFGVGMLSGRDYMFNRNVTFDDASAGQLRFRVSARDFRNDGAEPILITQWVLSTPTVGNDGGHRFHISCNARIVGGSTNAWWAFGPQTPVLGDTAPQTRSRDDVDRPGFDLLGVTSGHAVVHRFHEPLVWLPGDGLDNVKLRKLQDNSGLDLGDPIIDIGLCGYITIA